MDIRTMEAQKESLDKHWYRDRYQSLLVQRRWMAAFTVFVLACALVSLLIILALLPQKTIEPYVIQVDQRTGITQYVNPETAKELAANEAVKNYFIVTYIRAREGYNAVNVFQQYDIVRLMSEPQQVYQEFREQSGGNNPNSNVARLGSLGIRNVVIKSITYLEPTVAQVRIVIEERSAGRSVTARHHKIVLIRTEFANIPLSIEERYTNPLGFRVLSYRVDEDVA